MNPILDEWRDDDAGIRLILGDCHKVMPLLKSGSFDAVVTDPQYGIGMSDRPHSRLKMDAKDWDSAPADLSDLPDVPKIVWGGNYFGLPPSRCFLVWDKRPTPPSYADCELAWTSLDRNASIWKGRVGDDVPSKFRSHPTQKPVGLMVWCLGFLPDAKVILDPYMGSGSTGVACVRTGRGFIGIEQDREYWEIAISRHEKAIKMDRSSFQLRPKVRNVPSGFFGSMNPR